MKLLQIIVLIIAVYTVDCRDDPDGYEDLDSTAGEPEALNSSEIVPEQEKTIPPIQDSMDGNSADRFYSTKTGHIIPRAGTLDTKINNLEQNLREMQVNLANAMSNFNSMASQLVPLMESKYYVFYNDIHRSWTQAKEKCQQEGMALAEPTNPLPLRKHIIEAYGQQTSAYAWLGARATGSYFKWETSGRQISNTDSLWYNKPSGSSLSTSRCLMLLAHKGDLSSSPNQPYYSQSCTVMLYTLCEVV